MMTRSKIVPLNQAAAFDISELFFSTTDGKGKILTCNSVFTRIAGYSPTELLGAPHNIIRHPDMPKCVFHLLWDHLLAGRPLGAYVKNMASSGAYYWVFALAFPLGDGFLSIRLKPSTETLQTIEALYARLLKTEQSHEDNWRKGMEASEVELMEALAAIGFESYEKFMFHALREELSARDRAIEAQGKGTTPAYPSGMMRIFRELEVLDQLTQETTEQSRYLAGVSEAMKRIGLNASICAAQFGEAGLPLGVLSEQATTVSREVAVEAQNLGTEQVDLARALDLTAFHTASATLISEMLTRFQNREDESRLGVEEQVAAYGGTYEGLSKKLSTAFDEALDRIRHGVSGLRGALRSFAGITQRFSKILLTTRMNQTTGHSIAASIPGGQNYSRVLDEMAIIAENAREALDSLLKTVDQVESTLEGWKRGGIVG